ncbi:hypothetical protein I9W82_005309 [Candida metapsilosis]|uniref:TAFII55 protein conserved region domain-containing protein n=1 Tax=Candida metapsilosis TaxID=273372 RepID=A0A8H7Z9D4_9ASCO|nr:hypothetical protein I9W82_005309 [Candida metapsilosis]
MALKLKLKVRPTESPGNQSPSRNEDPTPKAPTLKIKPPQTSSKRTLEAKEPSKEEKPKKLKLSLSKGKPNIPSGGSKSQFAPRVRIKPTRIPGEGYDSEAPDLEDDPLIEQGIVLRFLNDTNLEFVHNAVESGDLTGLNVKWITREKAVVNINGTLYSARLIDLPTLVEVYKTVDKKNILKNFDVSQILLVLHKINPTQLNTETDFEVPEEYLFKHPFYDHVKNHEVPRKRSVYRNGVLEPFKDVYRRFRPTRADHRVIQDIEDRVDALIKLDNEAEESHFELIDASSYTKYGHISNSPSGVPSPYPESLSQKFDKSSKLNLEGVSDSGNRYQTIQGSSDVADTREDQDPALNDDDFEINLEEELNKVLDDKDASTDHQVVTVSPQMAEILQDKGALVEGSFPEDDDDGNASDELLFGEVDDDDDDEEEDQEEGEGAVADEDDDGDDGDEEDDEDGDDEEDDEDKGLGKESFSHTKLLEEEITELEKAVEKHRKNLSSTTDTMMKMKLQSNISSLKASLEQKKRDLSRSNENEGAFHRSSVGGQFDAETFSDKNSDHSIRDREEDAADDDEDAEEAEGSDNNNDSSGSIDDLF